jgi:hypothetical protein
MIFLMSVGYVESASAFPHNFTRLLVLPQAAEFRLPQVPVRRPLRELHLRNQLGP